MIPALCGVNTRSCFKDVSFMSQSMYASVVPQQWGVKEVMYYAAAAQWVMLWKELVCGFDRICGTTLRRF